VVEVVLVLTLDKVLLTLEGRASEDGDESIGKDDGEVDDEIDDEVDTEIDNVIDELLLILDN
jgi:hypothetical protein